MQAAGEELLRDLIETVLSNCGIFKNWEEIYTLNLYKGKCDALDRGNYLGLKLTYQYMKLLERVPDFPFVEGQH